MMKNFGGVGGMSNILNMFKPIVDRFVINGIEMKGDYE